MTTIPEAAYPILDEANYATLATIQPDGSPQASVVWVKRVGNDLVFSTIEGRRKQLNLARDPRCSIVVFSPDDPLSYIEVRGECVMTPGGGRELIDELAQQYLGVDRYQWDDGLDVTRLTCTITPTRVVFKPPRG